MNAKPLVGAVVALAVAVPTSAQETKPDDRAPRVEQITVTASPLRRGETEMAQPATVLTEEDLRRKRAASIGDTLAQETGVQSSAFGAASGRPIIRGLDGPRIRVLENGLGTLDASNVSPDHMVTSESLHAEQIEILRGPASLLYGSGAIGGIVNIVTGLVPRKPAEGLSGSVEARAASGNDERSGGANLDGGAGPVAWHLEGFRRKTRDYRLPEGGRLADSWVDAEGGGAGASWVTGRGYLGAAAQRMNHAYGVPTGEGSHIRLRQERYEAAGESSDPFAGASRVRFRSRHTDYRHVEVESSGEVATTFLNKATESRIELAHRPVAGFAGTIGLQHQDQELSALGEEAVIPPTRSRATGVFIVEERELGDFTLDLGFRFERATRAPRVGLEEQERFGELASRRFDLVTPAAGLVWKLSPDYRLAVSVTQAQRAPSIEELYSLGAHRATSTFDVGDPALRKEVSRNVDLTFRKVGGESRWKVNLFANRVRDYVFASSLDLDGDGIPDRADEEGNPAHDAEFLIQAYTGAEARFRGVEAEWSWHPARGWGGVRLFGDLVRGRLASGENLPRMSPARVGAEVDARIGAWSGNLTIVRAFTQRRTAPLESATPGYSRVDAELAHEWSRGKHGKLVAFLQARNLLDRTIRIHTSYLKELAPQMGRSFALGLRSEF